MKLNKIIRLSVISGLFGMFSGTYVGVAYGAESNLIIPGVTTGNNGAAQATTSPQIEAAAKRVEIAKTNLDMARKRLDASKALLKAADAELRAAKTDKDALVLTTQAQQLADASGLPKNGENIPAAAPQATTSVSATQSASPAYSNENTIDFSGANSQQASAPAPSAQ